jgi:hypothetical protein
MQEVGDERERKKAKKRAREGENGGERELEREASKVLECKTGSQCPTGQDRILFLFAWDAGRCINFPTTHSVSCPSIILELSSLPFCPLALLLRRESKLPTKNKSSNHTKLLTPDPIPLFSVVSHHHQTDNTTTTKRKREKKREKKTNKKIPKENQAKELQQQQ